MNKKSFISKISIYLIIIIYISGCNETPTNQNDDAIPKITASIIGDISLDYKAPGPAPYYSLSDKYKQLILTSGTKYQNQYYAIGVYIFFADKIEKTGTFSLRNKEEGEPGDFAVAVFQVGEEPKRLFFSDSGKVTISKINGITILGTFHFYGTEQNGTAKVQVINGTLDFGSVLFY